MVGKNFEQILEVLLQEDVRYARGAYHFVRQALTFTIERMQKMAESNRPRHIKGVEFLNGIRDYALEQYGPMAHMLFVSWGITRGEDFGYIVFNLVKHGVLSKTQDDSIDDFKGHLDFHEAFVRPYLPHFQKKTIASRRSRKTRPSVKPDTSATDEVETVE